MANKSRRGRHPTQAKKQQAKYSPERLTKDLDSVRKVYANLGRGRFAIYGYWHAVYKLRRKWRRLSRNEGVNVKKIAKRTVKAGIPQSSGDDLLRLILDETMTTNVQSPSADSKLSKLKSKYFSLLNYVYKQRVKTPDVEKFIEGHGGLNFKPGQKLISPPKKTKQKKSGRSK
jgi:hypothetical protein